MTEEPTAKPAYATVSRKCLEALCDTAIMTWKRGRNAHTASCTCPYCLAIREASEALARSDNAASRAEELDERIPTRTTRDAP